MKKITAREYLHTSGISVAEHVTAMLAYWDKNLVCRFANSAYRQWFGTTPEQMINKITIKELLGPLYEKNLPYITGALKGNIQTFEREIQLPSGGTRHTLANYFPYAVNGEVKGFFSHVTDVSLLKQQEKDLLKSNETITQQNGLLLNFSSILSQNLTLYEKRLQAITAMLANNHMTECRPDILCGLNSITEGFRETVNNLDEIAKVQSLSQLKPAYLNLYHCIENAISIMSSEINNTHTNVRNNVSPGIKLFANAAYLQNVLVNFLASATEGRHPERAPIVEFDTFLMDRELILRIKDNGTGISPADSTDPFPGMNIGTDTGMDKYKMRFLITKFQIEAIGGRVKIEVKESKGRITNIFFKLV